MISYSHAGSNIRSFFWNSVGISVVPLNIFEPVVAFLNSTNYREHAISVTVFDCLAGFAFVIFESHFICNKLLFRLIDLNFILLVEIFSHS